MHFCSSESRESRIFEISALKTIVLKNKTELFRPATGQLSANNPKAHITDLWPDLHLTCDPANKIINIYTLESSLSGFSIAARSALLRLLVREVGRGTESTPSQRGAFRWYPSGARVNEGIRCKWCRNAWLDTAQAESSQSFWHLKSSFKHDFNQSSFKHDRRLLFILQYYPAERLGITQQIG